MKAVLYRTHTGEIIGYVSGERVTESSTGEELSGETDVSLLFDHEMCDSREKYVSNGSIADRPEMPVTINGNTLTVPINTTFKVNGFQDVATDGVLEFDFSEPGVYNVHLSLWPYRNAEVTLEG